MWFLCIIYITASFPKGGAFFACGMHVVLSIMLEVYLKYVTFLWLQFVLMYLAIAVFFFFLGWLVCLFFLNNLNSFSNCCM